jgi:hypothetical protein
MNDLKVVVYQEPMPDGYEFLCMIGDSTMLVLENPKAKSQDYMKHHNLCPYDGQYITSCLYCITLNQGNNRAQKLARKLAGKK